MLNGKDSEKVEEIEVDSYTLYRSFAGLLTETKG